MLQNPKYFVLLCWCWFLYGTLNAQSWEEQSFNGLPRNVIFTRLVDWDDDGDMDILGLEQESRIGITEFDQDWVSRLVWYENEPSGKFPSKILLNHYFQDPISFEVLDFNRDGLKDILLASSNGISWFQGQPNHSYVQWTIKSNRVIKNSQTVDLNGDGYLDVIACIGTKNTFESRVALFINDTKGQFKEIAVPNTRNFHRVQAGDVNNDGHIDIVGFIERQIGGFYYLLGKPELVFGDLVPVNIGDQDLPKEFTLKDYNLDGSLDIVVCFYNPRNNILVLDGSQNFKYNPNFKISPQFKWEDSGYMLPVDFDQDQSLDLLFTNLSKNGIIQVYNPEKKSFQTLDQGFKGDYVAMMTTGDLDKDGDIDLIYAVNDNIRTVFIWLENIQGDFYAHQIFGRFEDIHSIKMTDYDLDGDEDILFSCAHYEPRLVRRDGLYLLENRGAGVYQNWYIASFHHEEQSLQFEDVDRDDDLDIVVLSANNKTLSIYLNNQIPYGWTVQSVASGLETAKEIRTFYTNDGAGILSWNTKNAKLEVYLRNPDDGAYLTKTLFPSKGKNLQAEMVDLGLDGRYNLAIHSQDSAQNQRLSLFRFSGDWNIEESYTLKEYKSLSIFPVRARAGAQALFFVAEKQGKAELFALKKGFRGYELNTLYQFKYSGQLYKSNRYYLFQTDDFLYFQDGDEVFKVNLKDPKSIEKEILKGVNLKLLQKIAVGGYKDGNFNQLVGSKFDGYISIFTKKP
jgi:FG-GAP-like repeat